MKHTLRFADDYRGPGQVTLGTHARAKLTTGQTIETELNDAEAAHFRRDPCYVLVEVKTPPDEEKPKTRKIKKNDKEKS